MLEGIRRLLANAPDLEVVAEAYDGAMLLELLRNAPVVPDLLITDLSMPMVGGIELTRTVKALYPEIKVLILTMHEEEEYVGQAMNAGAAGYLLKDDAGQELITAIGLIRAGCIFLSPYFRPHFNFMTLSAQAGAAFPSADNSQSKIRTAAKQSAASGEGTPPHKPHP